jgi:hypothetical protein
VVILPQKYGFFVNDVCVDLFNDVHSIRVGCFTSLNVAAWQKYLPQKLKTPGKFNE